MTTTYIARAGEYKWTGTHSTPEGAVERLLRPREEQPGLAGKVAVSFELEGEEVVIRLHLWGLESEVFKTVRAPLVVQAYE